MFNPFALLLLFVVHAVKTESITLHHEKRNDDRANLTATIDKSELNLQWLTSDILKIETSNFTYQYFHLDDNLLNKKIFISHKFLNIDFIKHTLSDLVNNKEYKIETIDSKDFFVVFTPKYPSDCYIKLLVHQQDFVCDIDQLDDLIQDPNDLTTHNLEILFNIFKLMYKEIKKSNIINNKLNHNYQIYDINKEFPFEFINATQIDSKNVYDLKSSVYFDIDYEITVSLKEIYNFKSANAVISGKLQNITNFNDDLVIQTSSVVKLIKYPYHDHINIFETNDKVEVEGRLIIKDKFIENSGNEIKTNIAMLLKHFAKDYVFMFPFYINPQTQIGYMNIKHRNSFRGAIIFEISIKQFGSKCKLFLIPINYYQADAYNENYAIIDGVIEGNSGSFPRGSSKFNPNDKYCFLFQCDEMIYIGELYHMIQTANNQNKIDLQHYTFIQFNVTFSK